MPTCASHVANKRSCSLAADRRNVKKDYLDLLFALCTSGQNGWMRLLTVFRRQRDCKEHQIMNASMRTHLMSLGKHHALVVCMHACACTHTPPHSSSPNDFLHPFFIQQPWGFSTSWYIHSKVLPLLWLLDCTGVIQATSWLHLGEERESRLLNCPGCKPSNLSPHFPLRNALLQQGFLNHCVALSLTNTDSSDATSFLWFTPQRRNTPHEAVLTVSTAQQKTKCWQKSIQVWKECFKNLQERLRNFKATVWMH